MAGEELTLQSPPEAARVVPTNLLSKLMPLVTVVGSRRVK